MENLSLCHELLTDEGVPTQGPFGPLSLADRLTAYVARQHGTADALEANRKLVTDQEAELKARREILDAVAANVGDGNCWLAAAEIDWRQRLRDFAEDREQHRVSRADWKLNRGHGVDLYARGGFFVAYYDDAAALWNEADDTRPMFHVMVWSDPPHRCVVHPLHLAAWVKHLAEICMPVQILCEEMLEGD